MECSETLAEEFWLLGNEVPRAGCYFVGLNYAFHKLWPRRRSAFREITSHMRLPLSNTYSVQQVRAPAIACHVSDGHEVNDASNDAEHLLE